MTFLYGLGIRIYYLVILIVSPFNSKARLWLKGRRNIFKKMQAEISGVGPLIWFHASSLGEFEQGRPLIEAIKHYDPEYRILLTFFSPSGYEVRKNYSYADYIYYLPLDTRKNATKFIEIANPDTVIFIKYEFWYNYLNQIIRRDTRLVLISTIFRPDQIFFKFYGRWYKKMLKCFDHLFVQDEQSLRLLSKINVSNVTITGDTRFDRVMKIASDSKKIDIVEKFINGNSTIVCGSTWEKDEDILIRYMNETNNSLKFIIAPHEISQAHIVRLQQKIRKTTVKFSEASKANLSQTDVLIIDNVGMLASLYRYGEIAYVGGGFGSGIHNILEAAVHGIPVIFGPNYHKFREANELIAAGGAFSVSSFNKFNKILGSLTLNNSQLIAASAESANYVMSKTGATEKILKYLIKR